MWKKAIETKNHNNAQYDCNKLASHRNDDHQFNLDLSSTTTNSVPGTVLAVNSQVTGQSEPAKADNSTAAVVAAALCNPYLLINLLQTQQQQHQLNCTYNESVCLNETENSNLLNSSVSSNCSSASSHSSMVKRKTHLSNCFKNEQNTTKTYLSPLFNFKTSLRCQ
jgi:hypothetical protein